MSQFPTTEKVQQLRITLNNLRHTADRIRELEISISAASQELKQLRERNGQLSQQVRQEIDAMDCSSSGNHGFMDWLVALLQILDQQAVVAGQYIAEQAEASQ